MFELKEIKNKFKETTEVYPNLEYDIYEYFHPFMEGGNGLPNEIYIKVSTLFEKSEYYEMYVISDNNVGIVNKEEIINLLMKKLDDKIKQYFLNKNNRSNYES